MSGGGEAVDLGLHPNMRRSFELKIPPPFVLIEMTFERANDVVRTRLMPFDQVAVIGVHHPNEIGQVRSRARMQPDAQLGGSRLQICDDVCDGFGRCYRDVSD